MPDQPADDQRPADRLSAVEHLLLGQEPTLTRLQVAEQAEVPLEIAITLWRLLGFPSADDDEVAFTAADVDALRASWQLVELGILSADRQAALVRTWGRSFARLAEWQTTLLAEVAVEQGVDVEVGLPALAEDVIPVVDQLQSYIWRRHLVSANRRLMELPALEEGTADSQRLAVCFVDIVGYTSRSKALTEPELVAWLEHFESHATDIVTGGGGRIIKNIGDEILFVCDDLAAAVAAAWTMTSRGEDEDDDFPQVRAGLAYGDVVARLGDVYGPVVNIAARLTSVARPGTVIVDDGAQAELMEMAESAAPEGAAADDEAAHGHELRRLRRVSVKGYSKLGAWRVRSLPNPD